MKRVTLVSAALIAASLLPIQAARAEPVRAAKLQQDARMLTHRAERAERRGDHHQARALRARHRARALRDRARRAPWDAARLTARADGLDTSAGLSEAKASTSRTEAKTLRSEAKRMQHLAKREAPKPARTVRNAGTIDVRATTPCRVVVDGRFHSYTPVVALRVGAGTHVVSCEALDDRSASIRVQTRERTAQRLTFDPK